jgi:uncharacterized protein YoxC
LNNNLVIGSATITPTIASYLVTTTSSVQGQIDSVNSSINTINTKLTGISYTNVLSTDATSIDNNVSISTGKSLTITSGLFSMGSTSLDETKLSYINGCTSNIQTQMNSANTNITALQTKTTNMSFASTVTTFSSGQVDISNNISRGPLNGSLVLKHTSYASGGTGTSSIVFPSATNNGNDYAYIEYRDSFDVTSAGERSLLIIGSDNDPTNTSVYDRISLYASGTGYIGINTLTPTYNLDVNGNMRVVNAATFQNTITSAGMTTTILTVTDNISCSGATQLTGPTTISKVNITGGPNTITGDTDFNESTVGDNCNFFINSYFNSGVYIENTLYPSMATLSTNSTIANPYKQVYIVTGATITITLGTNALRDGVIISFKKILSGTTTVKTFSGALYSSNSFTNVGASGSNAGYTFIYHTTLVYYNSAWYALTHS